MSKNNFDLRTPLHPKNVKFPRCIRSLEEEMADVRSVSATKNTTPSPLPGDNDDKEENTLFNLNRMQRLIASMKTRDNPSLTRPEVNSGITNVPLTSTFQSSDRHTDVSPLGLSEHWCISIPTAIKTLKNTA